MWNQATRGREKTEMYDVELLKDPVKYSAYKHDVRHSVTHINSRTELVRLIITEKYYSKRSIGGSSFRIEATSPLHSQICGVKDYFNGTYLSCCNVDTTFIQDVYRIGIRLKFGLFRSYSGILKSRLKKVWSHEFHKSEASERAIEYRNCTLSAMLNTTVETGYWLKDKKVKGLPNR